MITQELLRLLLRLYGFCAAAYRRRADERDLLRLSDRTLKDMGVSRGQIPHLILRPDTAPREEMRQTSCRDAKIAYP